MTDKVKSWSRDSIHASHDAAAKRLADLGAARDGDTAPLAKIHLQTRGFIVKVWTGILQAAPQPKKKPEAPSDGLLGL
jgi:hypothetical protein